MPCHVFIPAPRRHPSTANIDRNAGKWRQSGANLELFRRQIEFLGAGESLHYRWQSLQNPYKGYKKCSGFWVRCCGRFHHWRQRRMHYFSRRCQASSSRYHDARSANCLRFPKWPLWLDFARVEFYVWQNYRRPAWRPWHTRPTNRSYPRERP